MGSFCSFIVVWNQGDDMGFVLDRFRSCIMRQSVEPQKSIGYIPFCFNLSLGESGNVLYKQDQCSCFI